MRLNAVLVIALTNPRDITLRSGGIGVRSRASRLTASLSRILRSNPKT